MRSMEGAPAVSVSDIGQLRGEWGFNPHRGDASCL